MLNMLNRAFLYLKDISSNSDSSFELSVHFLHVLHISLYFYNGRTILFNQDFWCRFGYCKRNSWRLQDRNIFAQNRIQGSYSNFCTFNFKSLINRYLMITFYFFQKIHPRCYGAKVTITLLSCFHCDCEDEDCTNKQYPLSITVIRVKNQSDMQYLQSYLTGFRGIWPAKNNDNQESIDRDRSSTR